MRKKHGKTSVRVIEMCPEIPVAVVINPSHTRLQLLLLVQNNTESSPCFRVFAVRSELLFTRILIQTIFNQLPAIPPSSKGNVGKREFGWSLTKTGSLYQSRYGLYILLCGQTYLFLLAHQPSRSITGYPYDVHNQTWQPVAGGVLFTSQPLKQAQRQLTFNLDCVGMWLLFMVRHRNASPRWMLAVSSPCTAAHWRC
jgi:hypothetical protein